MPWVEKNFTDYLRKIDMNLLTLLFGQKRKEKIEEKDYLDIENDQSCHSRARVVKGIIPCGIVDLVVGTYNIAVNDVDLGSTTGGFKIKFDPYSGHWVGDTTLQSVTSEHMEMFGFSFDGEKYTYDSDKILNNFTMKVYGPGPGCACRTWVFENCSLDMSKFEYALCKDYLVQIPFHVMSKNVSIYENCSDDKSVAVSGSFFK